MTERSKLDKANHLTDVALSDQHTVKPWLDVKLDFAACVVDLSGEGFPFIGGRLDLTEHRLFLPPAAIQRRMTCWLGGAAPLEDVLQREYLLGKTV